MPEEPLSFRRKLDEKFWLTLVRDRDKPFLDPYSRWISANEKSAGGMDRCVFRHRHNGLGEDAGRKFCLIPVLGYGTHEYEAINQSIRNCTAEYIILHMGDIRLSPDAFFVLTRTIARKPGTDFIYSDEDGIDEDGVRTDPFFKPGWSPDTMLSFLYTGSAGVFRTELLKEIGGFRSEYGAAAFYDLVLRFTEKAKRIVHIPRVLYHVENDDKDGKQILRDPEAEVLLKEDALRRRGLSGTVHWNEEHEEADIVYAVSGTPLVSIIIPSKDHYEMLSECLASIREYTSYLHYELIIVDNGSCEEQRRCIEELAAEFGAEYLYHPMEFNFSAMCNLGAEMSKGEYLLFLNDDIKAVHPEWLERMLGQAQQKRAGAVGAKLLYPESDLIQHVGILNLETGPVHALMGMSDGEDWYHHRNRVTYNCSAVTGACLLVSRKKFDEAGRVDEDLSVGYNDVGVCFRLMELGYYNSIRNDAILIHYESASRGLDEETKEKRDRLNLERKHLYKRFPRMTGRDPFYNRNLNPAGSDYSLNMIFLSKPVERKRGLLPSTKRPILYSIEDIHHIEGVAWEITGWISAGRWEEYSVRRFLVLEDEDGEDICFRLNRIGLVDSSLERIRDEKGSIFTGYVGFHLFISEKVLAEDRQYRVCLMLELPGKHSIAVKTDQYLG